MSNSTRLPILIDEIASVAQRQPDATALVFEDTTLTYADLMARVNCLRLWISNQNLPTGSLIGLCTERSFELVIGVLGIVAAGCAYVPLDPDYPVSRLQYITNDAGLKLILTSTKHIDLATSLAPHAINLERWSLIEDVADEQDATWVNFACDDLIYVMYTSGSTGQPKGVMVPHNAVANRILWMRDAYNITPADVILHKTPFSFDVSVWELLVPLISGATMVIAKPGGHLDPDYIAELIKEHSITGAHFVPSMLSIFLETDGAAACASLKWVYCSGETLPAFVRDRFFERMHATCDLYNMYGPTEAAIETTWWKCSRDEKDNAVPIGYAIPNVTAYILDENGKPVNGETPGELYHGGICVAKGYLNRPELTSQVFVPDPFANTAGAMMYRTGDLVKRRPDGAIEYLSRLDFQVKIRGQRIELGEIETVIATHGNVKSCVVIAREDVPGDQRLVAYLTADSTTDPEDILNNLKNVIGEKLPAYMAPAHWVVLDELPVTSNGKLNRKALPAPVVPVVINSDVLYQNELEEKIAAIWRDILRLPFIDPETSFFNLGGHSLLAGRLILRLRNELAITLGFTDVFRLNTVRLQALSAQDFTCTALAAGVAPSQLAEPVCTPASYSQESFWYLQQMAPTSPAFKVTVAYDLKGALCPDAICNSIGAIVARHEPLRTSLEVINGQLTQCLNSVPHDFHTSVNVSDLPEGTSAESWLAVRINEPLCLNTNPFRSGLLLLSSDHAYLLLEFHHACVDAWSLGVIERELSETVCAQLQNRNPGLLPLPCSYKQASLWQRKEATEGAGIHQRSFWGKQLQDLPTLNLPTDYSRSAMPDYCGNTHVRSLSPELVAGIQALCSECDVTQHMVFLSAVALLISRYAGVTDVPLGTPAAGRRHSELEALVGCFINSLVVRLDLAGNPTVSELLSRTKSVALSAYENQDLPFEHVVEALNIPRDSTRNPLFQVLVNQLDVERSGINFPGVQSTNLRMRPRASMFDLVFLIQPIGDGIDLELEYMTSLFDPETIDGILDNLIWVLQQLTADANQPLTAISACSPAQLEQISSEFNLPHTETAADTDTADRVIDQCLLKQDKPAVRDLDGAISYKELNDLAFGVANSLALAGVKPGDTVAVSIRRSRFICPVLLGVWLAGAAYLPIDPEYPQSRIEYMLTNAEPVLIICDDFTKSTYSDIKVTLAGVDSLLAVGSSSPLLRNRQRCAVAYTLYTSGSTGQPKGVVIPHTALSNFLLSMQRKPGFTSTERLLAVTTLSFDISELELWLPLVSGGTVTIGDSKLLATEANRQQLLDANPDTVLQTGPALFRLLLDTGWKPGFNQKLLCGGEAMPSDLARELLEAGAELWNMYGPTETTIWSTCERVLDPGDITVGKPIRNTQIAVVDCAGKLAPLGGLGEIYIGGDGLAVGYDKRSDLTEQQFVTSNLYSSEMRWYKTGDLGKIRKDGRLIVEGRKDTQLKIRGFRIETDEVECALRSIPGVADAAVAPRKSVRGDISLAAYIIIAAEPLDFATIRAELQQHLPAYMVPSQYFTADRLPQTNNGKLDRAALQHLVLNDDHTDTDLDETQLTASEAMVLSIWRTVLGISKFDLDTSFFDAGGHSLLILKMLQGIETESGVTLPVASIFEAPSIRLLSRLVDSRNSTITQWQYISTIRQNQSPYSLFCFHRIDGLDICYRELGQILESDVSVIGFQSPDLEPGAEPCTNIQEMAARYVKDILRLCPSGPYMLAGSSFGGVLALECAIQLKAKGRDVQLVALIDAFAPSFLTKRKPKSRMAKLTAHIRNILSMPAAQKKLYFKSILSHGAGAAGLSTVEDVLGRDGDALENSDYREQVYKLQYAYHIAYTKYHPAKCDCSVTLFRAKRLSDFYTDHPVLWWDDYILSPINVINVTGDHLTMMDYPNVVEVASELDRQISGILKD